MSSSKATAKKAPARTAARKPTATRKPATAAVKPAAGKASAPHSDGLGPQMAEVAVALEKALRAEDFAAIPQEQLQQLAAAVTKAYRMKREAGEQFYPVSRAGRVTPTDIMMMANGLLRSGNLQIFELGMWQSWTGD